MVMASYYYYIYYAKEATDTSDIGHFGMSEVSRHFGTSAEMSFGHFGTILTGLDSLVITA